jgi:hypothetical protein
MVLIQLLLPTPGPAAAGGAETPLAQTGRELAARFGGLTAYMRAPAQGVWTAPDGHREHDDVVMVEVVTAVFDRPWWRQYMTLLAERFAQDAIHIRALPMQMLDDEAS